jgi:methylenetetrahydrofolate dehydrogenase (NADP+)/methenyltetrahydrofolate cyclohydrolase
VTANIIDGKAIAAEVRAEVARETKTLTDRGITAGLATVLVGDDPASKVYVSSKQKAAAEVGIKIWDHPLPASTPESDLIELIENLNADDAVSGILVQLPLPEHIDEELILNLVDPDKDADGFHPKNLGRLLMGDPLIAPATPAGIQQMLIRSNIETSGADVVIVGRSNIVGKPLANLLVQKADDADATVTVCHSGTKDLARYTREADVLVAAIGRGEFITGDMIKDGAVVVDVGMNRVDDASLPKGYRLCGDVDFKTAEAKASAITPVPGGVGPMTIAMLLANTVWSAERGAGLETKQDPFAN